MDTTNIPWKENGYRRTLPPTETSIQALQGG